MIPTLSAPVAAPKQIMSQTVSPTELEKARASLEKDAPTGPPPSFEESYLARQAREALTPGEIAPKIKNASEDQPPLEPRAQSGFAEIRAISAKPTQPLLDKRS